jgi:hypothetical protein
VLTDKEGECDSLSLPLQNSEFQDQITECSSIADSVIHYPAHLRPQLIRDDHRPYFVLA